jgi:hypothetical protein
MEMQTASTPLTRARRPSLRRPVPPMTARSAGTSLTVAPADNTDTSVVAWQLYEPA